MSELSMVAKNWVGKHFERDLNSARLTLCTGEYCRLIRTESSGDGTSLVMVTSFVNHITFITMCITTINQEVYSPTSSLSLLLHYVFASTNHELSVVLSLEFIVYAVPHNSIDTHSLTNDISSLVACTHHALY